MPKTYHFMINGSNCSSKNSKYGLTELLEYLCFIIEVNAYVNANYIQHTKKSIFLLKTLNCIRIYVVATIHIHFGKASLYLTTNHCLPDSDK